MPAIAVRFSVSHKMVQKIKYQYRDKALCIARTKKSGGGEYSPKDNLAVLAS
jgi:hypothetical protein